jgi:hypothetical protein
LEYPRQISGCVIACLIAKANSVARYRINYGSAQRIEDYYVDYFSSQGWIIDSHKENDPNGVNSYKFHRSATCAELHIFSSKHTFSLVVWRDFWKGIFPLHNLFGITKFLRGWAYVLPACP